MAFFLAVGCFAPPVPAPQAQKPPKCEAWYQRMVTMDCPAGPPHQAALEAVQRGFHNHPTQKKLGKRDTRFKRHDVLLALKTRSNPNGEGILVTASWDSIQGRRWDNRERSVWLVLDRTVYALNENAARDIQVLFDELPSRVTERAGLAPLPVIRLGSGRKHIGNPEWWMEKLALESLSFMENGCSWSGYRFPACP